MTDREVLDEILGLLRVIAYEPDDDMEPTNDWEDNGDVPSDCETFTTVGMGKKLDNGNGGLPRVVTVVSPLSGEPFLWKRRRAGDSWVEEIEGIISFGKG